MQADENGLKLEVTAENVESLLSVFYSRIRRPCDLASSHFGSEDSAKMATAQCYQSHGTGQPGNPNQVVERPLATIDFVYIANSRSESA